jgi:hypothetical protein
MSMAHQVNERLLQVRLRVGILALRMVVASHWLIERALEEKVLMIFGVAPATQNVQPLIEATLIVSRFFGNRKRPTPHKNFTNLENVA